MLGGDMAQLMEGAPPAGRPSSPNAITTLAFRRRAAAG
jgi:hypothetical protein